MLHPPHAARLAALATMLLSAQVRAELPTGYLVWTKGDANQAQTRKLYRMTLPGKTDVRPLTAGEDIQAQVSPDGQWVAYSKAKLAASDYHAFQLWKLYLVSIHGVGDGRKEIKIDDDGYWPSWGGKNVLYYNQVDGQHSKIMRVTLSEHGTVVDKKVFLATASAFSAISEVNECFVAPDATWFAARTRGTEAVAGVRAFTVKPAAHYLLAKAGSIGCMPIVAPDGTFGIIAGAEQGIRWGDAPSVASRKEDQPLIPTRGAGGKAYHPGISSDGNWVLASHSTEQDHNAGPYDLYIYRLDPKAKTVSGEQALSTGGLNGWPTVWVGTPTPPPPPRPFVDEFYPSSYTLVRGETATLHWSTSAADQVELGGQPVDPQGQQSVQPAATTRYELVARSSKVSEVARAEVEITVNETAQAVVIESFTASAESIEQGRSTTLGWKVRNASTLDLNGIRAAPAGSLEVSPEEDTDYVLTARGHNGPVSRTLRIKVQPLSTGLLPDRGGFLCSSSGTRGAPFILLLLLAPLLLKLARRACGRDQKKRGES